MYASINFQTKKALKEAVTAGRPVRVWQPGPFGSNDSLVTKACIEGPHYPQPHRWYAGVWLTDGLITKVN